MDRSAAFAVSIFNPYRERLVTATQLDEACDNRKQHAHDSDTDANQGHDAEEGQAFGGVIKQSGEAAQRRDEPLTQLSENGGYGSNQGVCSNK